MDIQQISLIIAGWFAIGFLVAPAVGRFLWEADRLGRTELELTRPHATVNLISSHSSRPTRKRRSATSKHPIHPQDRFH